jgi:hypothetical protein
MMGEPDSASRQATPANLSSLRTAKLRQTSSCPALRMFTQNVPASRIRGQLVEPLSGKKATSGGLSDTEVKDPTTKPARRPSASVAVTTQTPVGYCPRTQRNHLASVGSPVDVSMTAPFMRLPRCR